MKKTIVLTTVFVAAAAGSAFAGGINLQNGDILFTNFNNNSVELIQNPGGSNARTNLVNYGGTFGTGTRLAGITQRGDKFYVANGPIIAGDNDWDTSSILEISNLFGPAPSTATFLSGAGAGTLQNPIDLVYNSANDSFLHVQNPFRRTGIGQIVNDGIYGTSATVPSNTLFYQEDTTGPRPFYEAGVYMTEDPQFPGSYLVTALNGGSFAMPGDDRSASSLWRFTPDFTNPAASTLTNVVDFAVTGFGTFFAEIRGITTAGDRVFVTNNFQHAGTNAAGVYEIILNPDGTYNSIVPVSIMPDQPEAIIYNPFTNKLVVSSYNDLNGNNNGQPDEGRIYQMNLDGSGLEVIADGVFARDFYIVPTPGALALAGLAGLAGLRRSRRN